MSPCRLVFGYVSLVACFFLGPAALAQSAPVCGTHVALDQSHSIILARDTGYCTGPFDKEAFTNEYRQRLVEGLPVQCHEKFTDAVNCCVYPEHEACSHVIERPSVMIMGSDSSTGLVKTVIREHVNAQNSSAARAEACRLARGACSESCMNEAAPQAAMMCERLAQAEHCEKAMANTYLKAACDSMRTLNRTVASGTGESNYVSVACHVQGSDAVMCTGY